MAKAAFWTFDRWLSIVLTLSTLAAASSDRLRALEVRAYDVALWLSARTQALSSGQQQDLFQASAGEGWVVLAASVVVGLILALVLPEPSAGAGALASLTLMLMPAGGSLA